MPSSTAPDRIYLQPDCCVSPHEGRQWCEDNVWPTDSECEATGVEYVRADLAMQAVRPSDGVVEALRAQIINTPETADFMAGVPLEAAHQRERWGSDHDAGKTPFDWFWLVGYLAQKAASSAVAGDIEKAKHHTISTAAALANWHAALTGADTSMRPGIEEPNDQALAATNQENVSEG